MRTSSLLLVTLWVTGCGGGTFDPRGGGGAGGDGDQLYLGTTAER
jgi:hypothetical protein